MNLRAYRLREALQLSALERLIVRQEIARCLGPGGVGLVSILLALLLRGGAAGIAGLAYFLIGGSRLRMWILDARQELSAPAVCAGRCDVPAVRRHYGSAAGLPHPEPPAEFDDESYVGSSAGGMDGRVLA